MSREELVDFFDKCFGIDFAPEWQRKMFFDFIIAKQLGNSESRPTRRALDSLKDGGKKPEFVIFDDIHDAGK